ncbi:MAG: hypothetical protein JO119_17375 [Acidobacteria bacterium]|nr:hypothetical protein [Acidobacteriota bacterium]
MSHWLISTLAVFALVAADVPAVERLRSTAIPHNEVPEGDIALFPSAQSPANDQQHPASPTQKSGPLQEQSKLDLIRYVSGEFAKATKPLPRGKDGFYLYVGQPLMLDQLDREVANHGAAVNVGDNVQITKLEFHDHTIAVDVNGGGKGKRNWRDHIQMGMGGGYPTGSTSTTKTDDNAVPGVIPGTGSTIYLEFKKSVPDITPDDLKQLLAPFLDFTKQRSASVHWVDTLSPELKKAIQDRRPTVGMDREEVVAAIGKPEHKVRERDSQGNEIEDWIYGQPPSKTVFVRFQGERVTSIRQFPQ